MPNKNARLNLIDVAERLNDALLGRCALIGGMCSFVHGNERMTTDVDMAADDNPVQIQRDLQSFGIKSSISMGSYGDPLSWAVKGEIDKVEFQILPAKEVCVDISEVVYYGKIPVASLSNLIASKCKAGGHQDLHDVAVLSLRTPECREFTESQATKYKVSDKLALWLTDERLLARYGSPDSKSSPIEIEDKDSSFGLV